MPVLILAVEDLGFRWVRDRGVEATLGVLFSEMLPVVADLVRKEDGFTKESLTGKKLFSQPLDLLENRDGSTFSESSVSTLSEAFRFPGDVEIAIRRFSKMQRELKGYTGAWCSLWSCCAHHRMKAYMSLAEWTTVWVMR